LLPPQAASSRLAHNATVLCFMDVCFRLIMRGSARPRSRFPYKHQQIWDCDLQPLIGRTFNLEIFLQSARLSHI
jgi:hypothetical protein